MKLTTKRVREVVGILDEIIEDYKEQTPKKKRDWRTYEQQLAHRIKTAKRKNKKMRFTFSFNLMDLKTRLYIGFGTSLNSEKEAFIRAMTLAKDVGIDSICLDRKYSVRKHVKFIEDEFGREVQIFIIPKKNATLRGSRKWKDTLEDFTTDTISYLGEYYPRKQSESAFSEDKRRCGWTIPQRRPDRVETHNICTSSWHNMLWRGNE